MRDEDAGMTMIDLVVTMTIMSIFMLMFSGAIMHVYRATGKTEAMSTAQAQLNTAFLRLDKEIRYASGISTPGAVGSNQYVEYLTTNTGTAICTELRLNLAASQLERRAWIQPAAAATATPTAWIPLASSVTSATPFTLTTPNSNLNFQRLRLKLTATYGPNDAASAKESDITFTALNTSRKTSSATTCTEGRSIP